MRSWPQGIKEIRDAREKAGAARQRMLDRFNERRVAAEREQKARAGALETKRNRFRDLSIPATLAAARRLRFIDLEADHHGDAGVSLNRPSLALLEMFLKALQGASVGCRPAMAARFAGRVDPPAARDARDLRFLSRKEP